MFRIAFQGLLAGAVAAGTMSVFSIVVETAPPVAVQIAALAGGSVLVSWWVLGVGRAVRNGLSEWLRLRRVRRSRLAALAAARAYEPTPTFGNPDDEATATIAELPKSGPRRRANLRQQAERAVEMGDFLGARRLLTEVLVSRASVADHLARGRVSLDLGDFNRAIADFMAAEDLDPVHPAPAAALGDLHFARKEHERALDHYAAARALNPDQAMVRYRASLCLLEIGEPAKALKELKRARTLDPDLPQIDQYIDRAKRRADAARKKKGADKSSRKAAPEQRRGASGAEHARDSVYHTEWGF